MWMVAIFLQLTVGKDGDAKRFKDINILYNKLLRDSQLMNIQRSSNRSTGV